MSATDGVLTHPLFGNATLRAWFSDDALIGAMLEVEAALAEVQADLGMVPPGVAAEIAPVCRSAKLLRAPIAEGVAAAGVPVPALLSELRHGLSSDACDWVHYGATSQDIVDTAFCLQFGKALSQIEVRLGQVIDQLSILSDIHRNTLMLARTRGQLATPITFGLRAAQWAQPLIAIEAGLDRLRADVLRVQSSGAFGSRSAVGAQGQAVTDGVAALLGLSSAPPEIRAEQIYKGVVPFIGLQALGVLLVWALPFLATWLPSALF
jgi:3-carboxy-cis,cis-muconate cycloisomerase